MPLGKLPLIDTPFKRFAVDIVGPIEPRSEKRNRDHDRLCNEIVLPRSSCITEYRNGARSGDVSRDV